MRAIETEGLTKFYGEIRGIEDLTLEVLRGESFGFLGPNGAGKTTTIRLLVDLLRPTSGSARVLGLDPQEEPVEVRRRIGYLPGELSLYETMTGEDLLAHASGLRGLERDLDYERSLARRFAANTDARIGSLSTGNKRKIGLLVALAAKPEVLLLDEPTAGLDPIMQREFEDLVREIRSEGRTIFLSSHNLPEVERACDRVAVVRDGRLVAVGDVAALKANAPRHVEATFAKPPTANGFEGLRGVRSVAIRDRTLTLDYVGSPDAIVKALAEHELTDLVVREPDLEDVVLSFYGRGRRE